MRVIGTGPAGARDRASISRATESRARRDGHRETFYKNLTTGGFDLVAR